MFAFYFALYTWLDFAFSHFAYYNCPIVEGSDWSHHWLIDHN